jgi:hypothetical protein
MLLAGLDLQRPSAQCARSGPVAGRASWPGRQWRWSVSPACPRCVSAGRRPPRWESRSWRWWSKGSTGMAFVSPGRFSYIALHIGQDRNLWIQANYRARHVPRNILQLHGVTYSATHKLLERRQFGRGVQCCPPRQLHGATYLSRPERNIVCVLS